MNVLIIEDEYHAAIRLVGLVEELRPKANVLQTLDSVEDSVEWLRNHRMPDLIFMDIQLADGLSFDIFTKVSITAPVIFTTAFDDYAIRAFKVNSVDYLLKPIDEDELEDALQKYESLFEQPQAYDTQNIESLLQSLTQRDYAERFLVKVGQQIMYVKADEIAYFFSDSSLTFFRTYKKQKHLVDYTLDQLDNILHPKHFFRINRKMIVRIESIRKVESYFNSRLILDVNPKIDFDAIVSRDRVKDFKTWLGA